MARNRFAGHCVRCRKPVQPGEGYFQRNPGRGWLVRCVDCVGKGAEPVSQATPAETAAAQQTQRGTDDDRVCDLPTDDAEFGMSDHCRPASRTPEGEGS